MREVITMIVLSIISLIPLCWYVIQHLVRRQSPQDQHQIAYDRSLQYLGVRGIIFGLITIPFFLIEEQYVMVFVIYVLLYIYNISLFYRSIRKIQYLATKKKNDTDLYVLNGESLYHHFKNDLYDKDLIIFNEALAMGENDEAFLSDAFIKERLSFLASFEQDEDLEIKYGQFVSSLRQIATNTKIRHIHLYFDHDMFCQINLLAMVYYLDQIHFHHQVSIDYIRDDYFSFEHFDDAIEEVLKTTVAERALLAKCYDAIIHNQPLPTLSKEFTASYKTVLKGVETYLELKNYPAKMEIKVREIYQRNDHDRTKTIMQLIKEQPQLGLPDRYYQSILDKINEQESE